MEEGLAALRHRLQRDFAYLAIPTSPGCWTCRPPNSRVAPGVQPQDVLHCAIVGGGQFGASPKGKASTLTAM